MVITNNDQLAGLTREQCLLVVDNNKLLPNQIKHMINGMRSPNFGQSTNIIKVGDILVNQLRHPALVFKIHHGLVYSVLLTSNEETAGIMIPCNSRFFTTSYITYTIVINTYDDAIKRFSGVYDCNKDITQIKLKLKQFYKQLLTF
jgi:hypothetical protein